MLVSPIEKSIDAEGMSQDGVTGYGQNQEDMEEECEREGQEDMKEECEEGKALVGRKLPNELTKAETGEHARTPCPYRSWCPHCVRSRARSGHHRKAMEEPLEEVEVPRVHMDYFFISREDEEASKNPLLIMVDERSGSRYRALENFTYLSVIVFEINYCF